MKNGAGTHPALLLLFACKTKSAKLVIGILILLTSSKGTSSDKIRINFSLFHVLRFLGMLGANQEEIAKTNGLITRAKALVLNHFREESLYFKQIELHSQGGRQDKCGRNELHIVMEDLKVLYDNFKKDHESLEETVTISLKFDTIIDVNLSDDTYEEVIGEINGTYSDYYFASMYIMVRKLFENLLYDCLKALYGTQEVQHS